MTLQLHAVTRVSYFEMTARLTAALQTAGAWIVAHQQFSNLSLCLNFEIDGQRIPCLGTELAAAGFGLSAASQQSLTEPADGNVAGTLQVTFLHNDPDLVVPLPIG